MGRRSINTTKSGKYMNPTDQARKEARKKELKKNKRQRQIVRTAVLRGKDPMQLLAEMEKIDQMEYNVLQPSPLNEKVLKDKRKKLRDTFDRVMKMYYKDDHVKWEEIKRCETEYDKRRQAMMSYYEAVRHAQQVTVDDIPLPSMNTLGPESMMGLTNAIPLPSDFGIIPLTSYNATLPPPPSILRKKSAYSPPPSPSTVSKRNKIPPGVPPGPPPVLSGEEDGPEDFSRKKASDHSSDSECDSDNDKRKKKLKTRTKAIRFAESESSDSEDELKKRRKAYSSGHDIEQFMIEMEKVHKKQAQRSKSDDDKKEMDAIHHGALPSSGQMPSNIPPPAPPLGVPPPLMFRPPPMMMGHGGIRLPPGPPPGRPPTLPPGPPPGLPPRMNTGVRLPPGPPPGVPPSMMRFSAVGGSQGTPNVVSAAPQLISREDVSILEEQMKSSATIEAKAKIRNLNADITRFLPTSVRIKRDDGKPKPKNDKKFPIPMDIQPSHKPTPNSAPNAIQPSKDDAYMQFMKEMAGLL